MKLFWISARRIIIIIITLGGFISASAVLALGVDMSCDLLADINSHQNVFPYGSVQQGKTWDMWMRCVQSLKMVTTVTI